MWAANALNRPVDMLADARAVMWYFTSEGTLDDGSWVEK
jgi:hypothetical protein